MKTPIKYIILVGITTILYLTSQDIITATDKSQLFGGYRKKEQIPNANSEMQS